MIKESLINHIQSLSQPLSEENTQKISDAFIVEPHTKHSILQKQSLICDKLYFIEKGLARLYYSKEGRDVTGWFASEGSFITCNDSFMQRKPSYLNLEVLEDSILYSINYENLMKLFKIYEMESFGRSLFYNALSELSERMYTVLFQDAEKRYQLFLTRYPEVAMRAPLGHIASFLGISQETLSRVRGNQLNRSKKNIGVYHKKQ